MKVLGTALLLGLALVSAGCTSPQSTYYKLSSEPIPVMTEAGNKMRLMVGPVSVPARLDRPQLVIQSGNNEVQVYEYRRWAGSLKGDIARVMGASLARDLGTPNVWSFSESMQTDFDYQVLIDVQTLESNPDHGVIVDVLWTIKPANMQSKVAGSNAKFSSGATMQPKVIMGRSLVREATTGPGFDALLAAQSRAFAKVAAEITPAIRR